VTEIASAEIVNTGSGGQFTISATSPTDWTGMSISVPAQSTPYQVEMFVPVVQSTTNNSIVYFQLVDGTSAQWGLISCQSLPNSVNQQAETFGPLIYTRRFPAFTGSTRTYKVRYARSGADWIAMLDAAGPNAAYIRADTV